MSRQYPFWKGIEKVRGYVNLGTTCALCGEGEADRVATVQVNWFRGDDVVAPVHHGCITQFAHTDRAFVVYNAAVQP